MNRPYFYLLIMLCFIAGACTRQPLYDLNYFLTQMESPGVASEMENSHTAMSSTWDRTGGNRDGWDFKDIRDTVNILLDEDGPGCIHRIFTGRLQYVNEFLQQDSLLDMNRTLFQIYIDHQPEPVVNMTINEFFTNNPLVAYPLVFDHSNSTYPGFLLPIPYAHHCKVQLLSLDKDPYIENWGNYWQITYTRFSGDTKVKSFSFPFTTEEKNQIEHLSKVWTEAVAHPPVIEKPDIDQTLTFAQQTASVEIPGEAVISDLRIDVQPNTPDVLKNIRLRIYWDQADSASVDVPLGYFFGNADYASDIEYNSLFMGIDSAGGYCRFPMPFRKLARIEFEKTADITVDRIHVRVALQKRKMKSTEGYFHATWTEQYTDSVHTASMPTTGMQQTPTHFALERTGVCGKYAGLLMHVAWPSTQWWGEGDVLIWTDENQWPPSYHGTGTEEYFNSGWCEFDRKAMAGFIKMRPGNVNIYTFHLNDAFNFQKNIRIGIEKMPWPSEKNRKSIWGTTAFWYGSQPYAARSKPSLLTVRLVHENPDTWIEESWR